MKRVQFRTLNIEDRFQLDGQWWIKMSYNTARHANFEAQIDVYPASHVLIRGEEITTPSKAVKKEEKGRIRKRDVLSALGEIFKIF